MTGDNNIGVHPPNPEAHLLQQPLTLYLPLAIYQTAWHKQFRATLTVKGMQQATPIEQRGLELLQRQLLNL